MLLAISLAFLCPAAEPGPSATDVVTAYVATAQRSYAASVASATRLAAALEALAAQPDAQRLAAAKVAWIAAREDYTPTEVYRFGGGPIDTEPHNIETKINAWPLDEQWVDATIDQPQAGLINGTAPITPEALVEANEKDGEKNIATGFHVIEFLLWGQDRDPQGPGNRPLTDFTSAPGAQRRTAYLTTAGRLLVQHLGEVAQAWGPHAAKLTADPRQGLHAAFSGAIVLAGDELSGERMAVAWETQDQEEEQSCFSDTTCRDHVLNAEGVQRVWLGLRPLVAARDPAIAGRTSDAVAAALATCQAIPAPFDRAIQGGNQDPGRKAVLAAIEALEIAADELVAAAKVIDVKVEFGANANNAIVGLRELTDRLPVIVAAVKADDQAAAESAISGLFDRWLRYEGAIRGTDPIGYKLLESGMNTLKNEAVRAKVPDLARVQSAADGLIAAAAAVAPKLKAP